MNNPKSYEHVETRYSVGEEALTVVTTTRGTNGFGAVVTNRTIATVDKAGNVLTLSTQCLRGVAVSLAQAQRLVASLLR